MLYEPSSLTCVSQFVAWWQYSSAVTLAVVMRPDVARDSPGSGTFALSSQSSCTVRPVLVPPWSVSPGMRRIAMFTSTPCQVLHLVAVVLRMRHQVVGRQAELRGIEVVHPVDDVAAAARQPRIRGRRDVELVEVRRAEDAVVGDPEVAVDAAEVADVHRRARHDFVLHAARELPVVAALAPAVHQIRVVGVARHRLAEQRVGHRAAFAVGERALEVAVRHVVAVRVVPGPRRLGDDRVQRVRVLGNRRTRPTGSRGTCSG